jgi:hypothetical protein
MPNLASGYHAGTEYPLSDSHVGSNVDAFLLVNACSPFRVCAVRVQRSVPLVLFLCPYPDDCGIQAR